MQRALWTSSHAVRELETRLTRVRRAGADSPGERIAAGRTQRLVQARGESRVIDRRLLRYCHQSLQGRGSEDVGGRMPPSRPTWWTGDTGNDQQQ
jgi:hypothetical protein